MPEMVRNVFFFLLFLMILGPAVLSGQDQRLRLEQDKRKIEDDIKYTNELLQKTRASRENSVDEVQILNGRISKRQQLLNHINNEIWMLNEQISSAYDSVKLLEADIRDLKAEYGKMIYYAYKNRSLYDRMMFVFAADDFNQAYQRLKYFRIYNEYRRKQASMIVEKQGQLMTKSRELEIRRSEKMTLLASLQVEKERLVTEKSEKDKIVKKLSKKEKELQKALKEKEEAARKLQKAIEEIIAEEIRKASETARPAGKIEGKAPLLALNAEEMKLSADFVNNRGSLPWPLDKGVVSGTFGEHPHPVLSNVKVRNNGIDILTDKGSAVKAIFNGVVTRVINVPNNNNVVIVRHGEFLSVYSNLDRVMVRKDQLVITGQQIGTVFTTPEDAKTELHFEIWQSKTLLDPESWLRR